MAFSLRKTNVRERGEDASFKGWMDRPKTAGAILPTSDGTERRMAPPIELCAHLTRLELGPGPARAVPALPPGLRQLRHPR